MADNEHMALAIVSDYESLHGALRARAEQLQISRETLDEISGLANGYASKILAPDPIKILGQLSFGPICQALGVKFVMGAKRWEGLTREQRSRIARKAARARWARAAKPPVEMSQVARAPRGSVPKPPATAVRKPELHRGVIRERLAELAQRRKKKCVSAPCA
jgi:hypothetical protein